MKIRNRISSILLASMPLVIPAFASAQSTSGGADQAASPSRSSAWYMPQAGYLGLNAGRSNFSLNSGTGGFPFDDRDTSYSIYGGGYFNNNFGLELGYNHFGTATRAGGDTEAQGINLSLIGKVPLGASFNLLGKIGTTYGHTRVFSAAGTGITAGSESGFGFSYGVGAEWAFTPNWSAVIQWDQHDLKYTGSGRDNIDVTSFGLRYRF